jgi:VanZ family protein
MSSLIPSHGFMRYQLPAVLWAAIIFVSSSLPSASLPKITILHVDKVAHFVIFSLFCVLTHRAIRFQNRIPLLSRHALFFSVLITILYGAIDETHQFFVPGRVPSWLDLSADAASAFLYAGAFWLWTWVRGLTRRVTQNA